MTGRKQGHYTQAARLIKLLDKLRIHHRGIAKTELAAGLGITARQLNRDLLVLAEADFETETVRLSGQSVRVKLVEDRVQKVLRLSQRQRYAMLAVLRVFDSLEGTPLHEDVQRIFGEITSTFPREQRRELTNYGERFVYLPDGGQKRYAS